MSAPDLSVDYGLLQQVENTLTTLKREFGSIDALKHATDWGDGGIESVMVSFASYWSHHRSLVAGALDALIKNAHEVRSQADHFDTCLAQDLTKK